MALQLTRYVPWFSIEEVVPYTHVHFVPQIVDFVASVLLRFDFDGAQAKLAECESVIVTDFFLSYLTSAQEFMESARLFIFETYCRIHQKIDLP